MQAGDLLVDRFELQRIAGEGGMGTVWCAHDRQTRELVAIKVLKNNGKQERLMREASVLSELRHPTIVRYIEHGQSPDGASYLVTEWLEGEDLQARLSRGPLSIADGVEVIRRIADALEVSHEHGVVHRDLKPSNVFLPHGRIDQAKVLDFGIARLSSTTARMTTTNTLLGTPEYMAPEQARGEPTLDARVDVFALGCVLFECLTSHAAFDSPHAVAALAKVLFEPIPSLRAFRPDAPEALEDLIGWMTEKQAADRPASAAAVKEALANTGFVARVRSARDGVSVLTPRERQLVTVVVAAGPPLGASTLSYQDNRAHKALAASYGAALESLSNGGAVCVMHGTEGTATDQAARAVELALALQKAMQHVRVAAATGRAELTGRVPAGEVIDRAAAMLGGAPDAGAHTATTVRVDEITADLLPARFDVIAEGSRRYVRGEREVDDPGRLLLGRPAPWVGRAREMTALESLFNACCEEPRPKSVLLLGTPGVGKSRLRYEFIRSLAKRQRPPAVWVGRGDPVRAGSAFGLIRDALRRVFELLDNEALDVRRSKMRKGISRHVRGEDQARVGAFLGELLAVPLGDEGSPELAAARREPQLVGEQLRRAFADFLRAECAERPVLLVLEDLQWGDLPSLKLVERTLRDLKETPFMVLAVGRPAVFDAFPDLGSWLETMRLEPFGQRAAHQFVTDVLGASIDTPAVERIVGQAEGNAFFLEELVRAHASGEPEGAPQTVLAMLQARIKHLEPELRRTLRAASIFGETFWEGGVGVLLGEPDPQDHVRESLGRLMDQELVTLRGESRFVGEREFTFRHSLVREAAYEMLTDEDRYYGHRLAGAWLEPRGEHNAVALAEHFENGGETERAVRWWTQAAREALAGNDISAIVSRAQRARALGATGELCGELRLLEVDALLWLGSHTDISLLATESMERLPEGSPMWFEAAARACQSAGHTGQPTAVEQLATRAFELARDSSCVEQCGVALLRMGIACLQCGHVELCHRLGELARGGGPDDADANDEFARGWWYYFHAALAVHEGLLGDALEGARRSKERFDEAGGAGRVLDGLVFFASIETQLGAYAAAEPRLRQVISLSDAAGRFGLSAIGRHSLGLVLARRRELDEAFTVESDALAALEALGDRLMVARCHTYLAILHQLTGSLDKALAAAQTAERASRGTAPLHAFALGVLADVHLGQAQSDVAANQAQRALAEMQALGGLPEGEARLRLVYARTLFASGREEAGRKAIAEARVRLRARANSIKHHALRSSFTEDVPENAQTLELAATWLGHERR